MRNTKENQRGLTFLDVMVAVAIMGIAAVTYFSSYEVDDKLAIQHKQRNRANQIVIDYLEAEKAKFLMSPWQNDVVWIGNSPVTSTVTGEDGMVYRITITYEANEVVGYAVSENQLLKLSCGVQWPDDSPLHRTETLSTYVTYR